MSILVIGELVYTKSQFHATNYKILEYNVHEKHSRKDFIARLKSNEYNDVVAIFRRLHDRDIGRFDAEIIEALPPDVKVISNPGAGYDQIDVNACTTRGIYVTNTPDAVREATADTALFLLLAVLRNFGEGMRMIEQGKWLQGCEAGRCPRSRKIGILGMGSIGVAFAKRCLSLGCSIQYHNRSPSAQAPDEVNLVTFDELLQSSDVIFVSVPLNDGTRHLLSQKEFNRMKPGMFLINTARGPIIDEEAMVQALDKGILRAVGLDVYENEPKVHPGLLNRPGSVLLPHMGTHTEDASCLMETMALENLLAVLDGRKQNIVPEQKDMIF